MCTCGERACQCRHASLQAGCDKCFAGNLCGDDSAQCSPALVDGSMVALTSPLGPLVLKKINGFKG
ncbi:hypothetical protein AJ87_44770 [Rhizobium yanglingense]|nr:hypothetical protein AJ87_44770 [Rhizobium yanglingense]